MIPPDGVKRTLNGVVDSVRPYKDCKVFDGELRMKMAVNTLMRMMIPKFC